MANPRSEHQYNQEPRWRKDGTSATRAYANVTEWSYHNLRSPCEISQVEIKNFNDGRVRIKAVSENETLHRQVEKAGFNQYNFGYVISEEENQDKIIQFLTILHTIEKIEYADILKELKIEDPSLIKIQQIQQIEQSLLLSASKCDVKQLNDIFDEMKKSGIEIDINSIRNSRNETLLMLAAAGNKVIPHGQSYEAVKMLLNYGANPFETSRDQRTALMEAANFGRVSVVNLLIDSVPLDKRVAYINQSDNVGATAQTYASSKYHDDVCKALAEKIKQTESELQLSKEASAGRANNSR